MLRLQPDDLELLDLWIKANAPESSRPEAVRRILRMVAMRDRNGTSRMQPGETELEMVSRHMADGDRQIEKQRALIAHMESTGASTVAAVALLGAFVDVQSLHCEHLARLQNRQTH